MSNAERTSEGWLIIDTEFRNDDPHVFDDCWHRGPYWVYSVRGTMIRIEEQPNERIGGAWNRLENAMRSDGLTGYAEVLGDSSKDLGYRKIHKIYTQEEMNEKRRQYEESIQHAEAWECYPD